jgi:Animal haem peroxidase/Catalase
MEVFRHELGMTPAAAPTAETLDAVRALLERGDPAGAVALLLETPPTTPAAHALLAAAYLRCEEYDAAARHFRLALDATSPDPALAAQLALAETNAAADVATPNPCPAGWRPGDPPPAPLGPVEASALPSYPRGVMEEEARPGPGPDGLVVTLGHLGGRALSALMYGATVLAGRELERGTWTSWYRAAGPLSGETWLAVTLRDVWRVLKLAAMREELNAHNLFRAYPTGVRTRFLPPAVDRPPNCLTVRTIDGTWNDLDDPGMGSARSRMGANVARRTTDEPLLDPDPRLVSRVLLTRDAFKPVPFLNLLAAAWIQFQVHDWFSHGDNDASGTIRVPLADGDPLRHRFHLRELLVPRTAPDPTRLPAEADLPPTFRNEVTHWWDGSQLYGSDYPTADRLRAFEGGRLRVDGAGRLPLGPHGVDETGFTRNWWVGLSLLHHLFAREHNAIAAMLAAAHPDWSDQRLYDTARMINAAVMAKIHTVEWTPAILPNPVLAQAMDANWYGFFGGHKRTVTAVNLDNPELFGIVGNSRNLHGVPYSLTQEFVAVYRMHSLLPDEIRVRALADDRVLEEIPLEATRQRATRAICDRHGLGTLLYSFGRAHPGALVLNNFPRALQALAVPGFPVLDMGTVDVLRDRERGVPRYNEFRRLLRLRPLVSFDEITDDADVVRRLREVYRNDIESLDLMIGCHAEGHRPEHFGFGETAFQVFILNASRRLQADRFYTTSYNETVYSAEGLEWIDAASMKSVLLRHHPELARTGLAEVENAFAPWAAVDGARDGAAPEIRASADAVVDTWGEDWESALPAVDPSARAGLAETYAAAMCDLQRDLAADEPRPGRTLHRKAVFASAATFAVDPHVPAALRHGPFAEPGRRLDAVVRLSNASGRAEPDDAADLRGLAVRITDGARVQDLLATNFPVSHARDTAHFVAAAALARGVLTGLSTLATAVAPWDVVATLRALVAARGTPASLAGETFWSRAQFQLGVKLVEFRWVPAAPVAPGERAGTEHDLTYDLIERVRRGPVAWRFEVRGWLDTQRTPLDDGRAEWPGPWVGLATLELPHQPHLSAEEAQRALGRVEGLGFSIANRWDPDDASLRGRGLLNEFRAEVYAASQGGRDAAAPAARACPALGVRTRPFEVTIPR